MNEGRHTNRLQRKGGITGSQLRPPTAMQLEHEARRALKLTMDMAERAMQSMIFTGPKKSHPCNGSVPSTNLSSIPVEEAPFSSTP